MLNKLYNSAKHILYVADMDTYEVLYTNAYTTRLLGGFSGQKCYSYIHGFGSPCELCPNKRLTDRKGNPKRPFTWDYYNHKLKRWYDAHVEAIKWEDGRTVRFEIAHDITDRKRDEKSLMQIIKNQQLLSEIPQIFSLIEDFDDRVQQALRLMNNRMELQLSCVFEYNTAAAFTKTYSSHSKNEPIDLASVFAEYSSSFNRKFFSTLTKETFIENRNSHLLPGSIQRNLSEQGIAKFLLLPLELENEVYGFLLLVDTKADEKWHDFEVNIYQSLANIFSLNYRRKTNQETIIESERSLRIANATKDKFFQIIAHDLKNPFTTILGFSELLLIKHDVISPEKQQKYLHSISTTAKSAYSLLENLLLWARAQDGTLSFNPVEVNLHVLLNDVIVLLKPAATKKNVQIIAHIPENILLTADEMMLSTIARNLIVNAIKFTLPEGTIYVEYHCVEEGHQVSIIDNGIGIDQEVAAKLFRVEEHHSTPGTENESGTGLGLVLCKEFVDKHDGKIWAESTPGKGSIFSFLIPFHSARQ